MPTPTEVKLVALLHDMLDDLRNLGYDDLAKYYKHQIEEIEEEIKGR